MEFLKSNELALNPAGYLINSTTKKPVTHGAFVNEQRVAHYLVSLAEKIKDKNFKTSKVDDLEALKREVLNSINQATQIAYVANPTEPTSKVQDELIAYALEFDKYVDNKETVSTINHFMNDFNTIHSIEEVGDYFGEGLVKLSKIYTIAEILAAVKINVDKLN